MNRWPTPVVLIGPMAAGKSHLGRYMASRYGLDFVDADQVIVARHGPIPELFARHGETRFREIEAEVVAELLADPRYRRGVIVLGGGAPMSGPVQRLLTGHTVAYLEVDLATVRPRITGNTTRPLLQPNPVRRWQAILDQRRATYERLARIRLDGTGRRGIRKIARELYDALDLPRRDHTP